MRSDELKPGMILKGEQDGGKGGYPRFYWYLIFIHGITEDRVNFTSFTLVYGKNENKVSQTPSESITREGWDSNGYVYLSSISASDGFKKRFLAEMFR
jgi:hypothetical protein